MTRATPHVVRLLGALAMVVACLAATPSATAEAASPRSWRSVDSGGNHSCAIRKSGDARVDRGLYCWGYNFLGVLGQPVEQFAERLGPTRVGKGRWQSVSASDQTTCGIGVSQTLYCWGYNVRGAIGDGTQGETNIRRTPKAVSGSWRSVSAGTLHTCGIGRSGALYCWGDNEFGQLGDGTTKIRTRPTRVGTRTDWATVEVRADHTCAIQRGGRLYCWGLNSQGKVGLGYRLDGTDVAQVNRPHHVADGVSSSTLGLGWTCYLASAQLSCMGSNYSGTAGNGTRNDLPDPTPVTRGAAWRQVSTMDSHTCGIATGRTLKCWGDNVVGQVGDTTRRDRLSPTRVGARADWASVSVGSRHTCGLKTDGRLYCWGSNKRWQTGASGRGPYLVPRLVS